MSFFFFREARLTILTLVRCLFNEGNDEAHSWKSHMICSLCVILFFLVMVIWILVRFSPFRLIGAFHLFVAFAPYGTILNQVIVVLNRFLMLVPVSFVSLLPMVTMFGADSMVPFGLALRIAVPEQQYPPTRTTVLVPSVRLNAPSLNHTPLAMVLRSILHIVG